MDIDWLMKAGNESQYIGSWYDMLFLKTSLLGI